MRISLIVPLALFIFLFLGCRDQVVSPEASAYGESGTASGVSEWSGDGLSKNGPVLNFAAPLSGDQEVPPVETNGTGLAKFKLSQDGASLSYMLNLAAIDGVTQSHIHCGAAGVNGPVVVFLFGFEADGVTVNGTLAEGTITAADVIPREDSPACPGGLADFEDLLDKMMAGETYVNVHTLAHPPGEIRGQIDRGNGVAR